MKRTTTKNSILMCALLGAMAAGQAMAVDLRYQLSGDYFDTLVTTSGANGWLAGGGGAGGLPGLADTMRLNWGGAVGNIVTLAAPAPLFNRFQLGVGESGHLVVNAGGQFITYGPGNSTVGNNGGATIFGRLTVNTGGEVIVTNVLFVGASASGIVTNDGGTVLVTSHLWVGSGATGVGSIYITNGGVFTVRGNIGLGTINASTPSNGKGSVYVQDGGVLKLAQISPVTSIQPLSVLDVSGSGVVIITNNSATVISNYVTAGRITSYGGAGTVGIDFNNTNVNQTTIFAIAPLAPPPTAEVWNPAANPSSTGKWNESASWTAGVVPFSVTKATFNVVGAIPCTVTNAAVADYVIMGDNGPGGTLTIANGGSLSPASLTSASAIGYNSNALMVVETGGSASFAYQLWIGLDPGSDGTLIMNGGTVSVAGMFGLGWQGGKGTAQINGGILNLALWDYSFSIQGASVMDITGSGIVVINGDQQQSVLNFISSGQITNSAGTLVVNYNTLNAGKTTIYPEGLYIPPAITTWDPTLNSPDVEGLWNNSTNWTGGFSPTNVTEVRLRTPDAIPCTVTNAAFAKMVRLGNGGPGGIMIITNGGSLVCSSTEDWNSIGMNNTGLVVVATGGSASYGQHLWIGFSVGAEGTLIMNGGTVSVGQMFGLGWDGGTGTALINGGTLNLSQWSASSPGSIAGTSLLNVGGTGKVVITGNQFNSISNYVSVGKITATGGTVYYSYDPSVNKTTISDVLLPAPKQSITAVSVSGGNVSITYETTHQHTYYIASSPSLSPAVWTPVVGSTNAATGAPVTYTFPVGGDQVFYRTVSVTP